MELSQRMKAVAGLVPAAGVLADIGTDHAYVPLYLIKEQRVQRAIAMDVKAGPLHKAAGNIRTQGLEAVIETRLSDGLAGLAPGEAEVIVIAGLGGDLMLRILQAHPEVAAAAAALVLQPQSALEKVRGYLNASGFTLAAEDMVEEDGKFYPMFLVRPGREAPFSEVEQYYGRQLLARRHPVLQRFLARQAQQNRRIRAGLSKNFSARATQRKTELAAEWQRIQAAKAWGQNGF